jgi:hypothetical protein
MKVKFPIIFFKVVQKYGIKKYAKKNQQGRHENKQEEYTVFYFFSGNYLNKCFKANPFNGR